MRLDDVADAQCIDVGAVAHGEGAGRPFVEDLGEAVGVHRVAVVILLEGEVVVVLVALGKAHAIGRFARGDDDLAHAELHRRLDDIVGGDGVDGEGGVVGLDQHARHGGKVHHRIGRGRHPALVIALEAMVHGERVEHLTGVRDVGDERVDAGTVQGLQVEVEDVIALGLEPGHHVLAGLAGAAGEDDALCHGILPQTCESRC